MTRYAVLPFCLGALAFATSADQEGEEACALQVHHAKQVKVKNLAPCAVGDSVACPGSGKLCAGDQCCPRTGDSNNKTFPCPSATPGWSGDSKEWCEQPTKMDNCVMDTFTAQCAAWVEGTGPKPSTCDEGKPADGCYLGLPPVKVADGAWCVLGKMTSCEVYANAIGTDVEELCYAPTFVEQCTAWVDSDGTAPKPSTCKGTTTDGCYLPPLPVSAANGAWCVDGEMTSCEVHAEGMVADLCASVPIDNDNDN